MVYWLCFILVAQFIMLNLFILVVLEEFETYYVNPINPINTFKEDVERFKSAWKTFSLRYEGLKIRENTLIPFFSSFKEPLG